MTDPLPGPDLPAHQWELVHSTYVHAMDSIERNEEMGERRLQVLFTVMSAASVGVGLVASGGATPRTMLWTGAGAALAVGLVGVLTVSRLARRNSTTTDLIDRLIRIRKLVAPEDSPMRDLFVHDPYGDPPARKQEWAPIKGGLIDIAGCVTTAAAGASLLLAGLALEMPAGLVVDGAVAVAVLAWLAQVLLVNRFYERGGRGGPTFRAGVGIVLTDGRGQVLVIERGDRRGAWQLPQGGLKGGEKPEHAARRELKEETGLKVKDVELVGELDEWLAYELPLRHRSAKTGRGQVQRWFLFALRPDAVADAPGPGKEGKSEVRNVAWMPFDQLLEGVVDFRRDVYRRVGAQFGLLTGEKSPARQV